MASADRSIAPRTDRSASRSCGGRRWPAGIRTTSSAARATPGRPPSETRPRPTRDATPGEVRATVDNGCGLPKARSPPDFPCHSGPEQRFPHVDSHGDKCEQPHRHGTAVSSAAMGSPSRLQAVIFDMDGTLIDSSWVVPAAFIATIEELGGPKLDRDQVISSYVLGPPATIMERFLGRPIEPTEIDGYHARLRAEAERRGVKPYPGIVEALEALARSAALGVFTNADLGNVDVLLLACERLEVEAARTAYVGDAPQDGETAHRAGALAVAARWGHLMDDVSAFDVVVDRPRDLPATLG